MLSAAAEEERANKVAAAVTDLENMFVDEVWSGLGWYWRCLRVVWKGSQWRVMILEA